MVLIASQIAGKMNDEIMSAYGDLHTLHTSMLEAERKELQSRDYIFSIDENGCLRVAHKDDKEDLYVRLKKLKDLLDEQIITDEEFQSQKKKILSE